MHIVTISAILAPSLKHLTSWKRINQRDAGWARNEKSKQVRISIPGVLREGARLFFTSDRCKLWSWLVTLKEFCSLYRQSIGQAWEGFYSMD